MEAFAAYFSNVAHYWPEFLKAVRETLVMVSISAVFIILLGILLGIALTIVGDGQICQNKVINWILPKAVNLLRSIPFVILLTFIMPFTRLLVGTAIGVRGAIVPLVVGLTPFVGRQVELSLREIDPGVLEMAESFGYAKPYIIFRIMLREARSGIVRGVTLAMISLVNSSTMAGVVGGGGVGDFAIRYGYSRMMTDITIVCIIFLLILVFAIQGVGNLIIKKTAH